MKSRSLWHNSNSASAIKESNLQEGNQILIKAFYSLISLGTERLVAKGNIPEDLQSSMAVPYMEGSFEFPVKYGYSLVGQVQSKNHSLFGKYVHLLHPHQDYCFVDEQDVFVIPDEVNLKTGTLASNLETALNAVWDSNVSIGDKVLVVGFGLIGSLVARLVQQIPGVELVVLEKKETQRKMAHELGFEKVSDSWKSKDLSARGERPFDIAFNCSASASGLQTCINATGFESKIIELSWYGDQAVKVNLGSTFHQQRKQLISSQVSNLPTDRRGRWDYKRRKETVFNLLKNPIFKHHISQTIKFASVPEFFDLIRSGKVSELGLAIEY